MHCNTERRIQETLRGLAQDPACLEAFARLQGGVEAASLKDRWLRFLQYAALDPYTPERVALVRQKQEPWGAAWVASALEVCKLRDTEFNLMLEESMTDRFQLAVALLQVNSD
ncbi:MAG: hypothetical protein WC314_16140 [Vulcanimicrobiota bacterium]